MHWRWTGLTTVTIVAAVAMWALYARAADDASARGALQDAPKKDSPGRDVATEDEPPAHEDDSPGKKPGPGVQPQDTWITHKFLATGTQTFIVEYDTPGGQSPDAQLALGDAVFADFEEGGYEGWVATGAAFGQAPVRITQLAEDPVELGASGVALVDSGFAPDAADADAAARKGALISRNFTIEHDYIRLLIGGSADKDRACIRLYVEGKQRAALTGRGLGSLRVEHIPVSEHIGKTAYLKIIDDHDKGGIRVDQIVFSDVIRDQRRRLAGGKIVWEYNLTTRDGWVLPDGHVLLALAGTSEHGGAVVEVDRGKQEHFRFDGTQKDITSVQPLPNGNILLAEAGAKPRLLEINRDGQIAVEVPLAAQTTRPDFQLGTARKLPSGNYLVTHLFDKIVREYGAKGETVWEAVVPHVPFAALRLDNGRTLVTCTTGRTVIELNEKGETVWQVSADDLPGAEMNDVAGIQVLPNGHIIVCDQDAGRKKGPKLIEFTRDKRVAWTYRDTSRIGIVNVHIIDTNGSELPGPALR